MQKAQYQYLEELKSLRTRQDEMIREWTRNASSREGYCCWAHQQENPNLVEIPPHKIPNFLHSNVANKKDPYFGALKSGLQQGESSHVADQATQNLLILRIKEKEQKEAWEARKEENRAIGQKQSYSVNYRVLTPRRHYPCLGMAEPQGLFGLIHHPMPRRDARRLGMDEVARKRTLHQGLNA
ncbi:hypothetical protein PIB30_073016 [Stylosanthes scabra]|uniref:Uncharacterized protein n=1 Tax=Stylosanthes scabra TaxID=79078 RepID=A0ABU6WML6_9FABA|nr:hypothetical protein [Stylosanthes scabra]